jgi:hypothetical protein
MVTAQYPTLSPSAAWRKGDSLAGTGQRTRRLALPQFSRVEDGFHTDLIAV